MLKRKGFTLIELMTVVLIIGVMTVGGVAQYGKMMEKARAQEGIRTVKALVDAANRYYFERGTYAGIDITPGTGNLDVLPPADGFFTYASTAFTYCGGRPPNQASGGIGPCEGFAIAASRKWPEGTVLLKNYGFGVDLQNGELNRYTSYCNGYLPTCKNIGFSTDCTTLQCYLDEGVF